MCNEECASCCESWCFFFLRSQQALFQVLEKSLLGALKSLKTIESFFFKVAMNPAIQSLFLQRQDAQRVLPVHVWIRWAALFNISVGFLVGYLAKLCSKCSIQVRKLQECIAAPPNINERLHQHLKGTSHLSGHCRSCGCKPFFSNTAIMLKHKDKRTLELAEAFFIKMKGDDLNHLFVC